MVIEQIYTGCLAHGAYYIENGGEAAVIDPLREVAPYIKRAERHGAHINTFLKPIFMRILCRAMWTSRAKLAHPLCSGLARSLPFQRLTPLTGKYLHWAALL
jgi:hypothetical protein